MSVGGERLSFEDDKGASRSTWIAGALLLAIVGWMGSGYLLPSEDATVDRANEKEIAPIAVAVERSSAKPVTLYFQAEGQALPDRDTPIRAEIAGDVVEILAAKGDDVAQGAVIARLSTARAEADLESARREVARAQRQFDSATTLLERGVASEARVSEERARLAAAEASLAAAEEALESSEIVAPFAGRIETLSLDEGEFVQAGAEVGRLVDNRPLTVAIQVPQQALRRIRSGQSAAVTFITGEEREGTVSFVGTSANAETRTFLTEIEVPNEGGAIPAGISAEIRIPTGTANAHFVQPSTVSLSPEGRLGVKTVGGDNKVVFHPIEVVRAEIDGIWVTGPPETARIITVGQGFVNEGETVAASPRRDAATDKASATAVRRPVEAEVVQSEPLPDRSAEVTTVPSAAERDVGPASDVAAPASAADAPNLAVDEAPADGAGTGSPMGSTFDSSRVSPADPSVGPTTDESAALAPSVSVVIAGPDEVASERAGEPTTDPPTGSDREVADRTAAVRTVQERLNALGYEAGPADGILGASTSAAIEQFRDDRGLDAAGGISAGLLDALAEAVRANDPALSGR